MGTPSYSSQSAPAKEQKRLVFIATAVFVTIGYLALNIGIWLYAKNRSSKLETDSTSAAVNQSPTASPTPTVPPLSSKGTYKFTVSAGGDTPGLITSGVLNPVDPPLGGKQEFEVTTAEGAENVVITLTTDTKEETIPLTKDSQKPNSWRGSWNLDDSYLYKYTLKVQGTVNGNTRSVPIMFR